jgi:hypothetical protein
MRLISGYLHAVDVSSMVIFGDRPGHIRSTASLESSMLLLSRRRPVRLLRAWHEGSC